jgi:YgiT-type zinc finger domain-containing protein
MIDAIRERVRRGDFEFSQHAVDQSIVRHISVREIKEAIVDGEIIEAYPDDKYGPSCLIFGKTTVGRAIHVQCSDTSRPIVKIITVYEPDQALWLEFKVRRVCMKCDICRSPMREEMVTYTIQLDEKLVVVEHVPAKVCTQCGERLYSPDTVERLQTTAWEQRSPSRVLQAPVFDFAAQ